MGPWCWLLCQDRAEKWRLLLPWRALGTGRESHAELEAHSSVASGWLCLRALEALTVAFLVSKLGDKPTLTLSRMYLCRWICEFD